MKLLKIIPSRRRLKRDISHDESGARLWPSKRISPEVGRSRPPNRFNSVDFPEPLVPRMATKSPRSTATETSASARTVSAFIRYSRVTLRDSRIAISLPRLWLFVRRRAAAAYKRPSRRRFLMSQFHYDNQKYLGLNIALGRCD